MDAVDAVETLVGSSQMEGEGSISLQREPMQHTASWEERAGISDKSLQTEGRELLRKTARAETKTPLSISH